MVRVRFECFSKLLMKRSKICIHLLKVCFKHKIRNDLSNGVYAMFSFFVYYFFMTAYFVGTHLNCIENTDCNLKSMVLLDCALIEIRALIRSNTVCLLMFTYFSRYAIGEHGGTHYMKIPRKCQNYKLLQTQLILQKTHLLLLT